MIKIFHNPRCSTSRAGLEFLKATGKDFEVVKYMENVPTTIELRQILRALAIRPIDLIRSKESIWKDNFMGRKLSDDAILQAMVKYPKLIERPIVINGDKAVIGRPTERIGEIL
ncbi:MAG: arsenate reductase (glutaredoxin) [Maribacter sp.]|nr:arsenate reductase (glutaredoxin) [Maribacter sp.]